MAMMPSLLVSRIWPWIDYEAKLLAKPSTTTKPSCKLCFLLYERFRHKISLFRRWMMMLILRRYHSVPVTRIYITRQQQQKRTRPTFIHGCCWGLTADTIWTIGFWWWTPICFLSGFWICKILNIFSNFACAHVRKCLKEININIQSYLLTFFFKNIYHRCPN